MKIKNHCKVDIKGLEMEKALKFLKHMKQTDTPYNFRECELDEAIAEIEAMKPKTCEGCKWLAIGKYCTLPTGCCIRKSDDYFKPKDNA